MRTIDAISLTTIIGGYSSCRISNDFGKRLLIEAGGASQKLAWTPNNQWAVSKILPANHSMRIPGGPFSATTIASAPRTDTSGIATFCDGEPLSIISGRGGDPRIAG